MSVNKLQLETDGLVVGVNQLVTSGNGVSVGNNLVVRGNTYLSPASGLFIGNSTVNVVVNSSSVYVNGGPLSGTNTSAQYTWTNTHTFNAQVVLNSQITLATTPFYENATNVTANYTISNGMNAFSAGPITINSGVVVTVPVGSTWSVS